MEMIGERIRVRPRGVNDSWRRMDFATRDELTTKDTKEHEGNQDCLLAAMIGELSQTYRQI
jgi:hypothetical protein